MKEPKKKNALFIIVLWSFMVTACTEEFSVDDVVGKFVWHEGEVKAVLTLKRNFTYEYRIFGRIDGFQHNGRWGLEKHGDAPGITFYNFIFAGLNGDWRQWARRSPEPRKFSDQGALWNVEIEDRFFTGLSLCFFRDGIDTCLVRE